MSFVFILLFILPFFHSSETSNDSVQSLTDTTAPVSPTNAWSSDETPPQNAAPEGDAGTPEPADSTPIEPEAGTPSESAVNTTSQAIAETTSESTPESVDTTPEPQISSSETAQDSTSPPAETTSEASADSTSTTSEATTSEAATSSTTTSSAAESTTPEPEVSAPTSTTTEMFYEYYDEPESDCPETCVEFVQGWKGDGDCDARCVKCPQFWESDGEFDGGDCIRVQNPETGEIEFTNPDNLDDLADEATDEPDWMECPSTCTSEMVGDEHCDKVECKYCRGLNGDPNFYNAKGVFDGNDCCDEICRADWVGDGDCDDDSSYWDFSCMHCDFFYDDNGVFDAGDCCASRCATPQQSNNLEDLARPADEVCDEMCAQCPNFYNEDGVFDGGDCGDQAPAAGTGLTEHEFDFDAQTADSEWNNPALDGGYYEFEDDTNYETCPKMCTDASQDWVHDGDCDYNMCKNCESFWNNGVFDGGDCTEQIEEVVDKREEVHDLRNSLFPNSENADLAATEESQWNFQTVAGIGAGSALLFLCCYCYYKRRTSYDFDDSGYGHSYDKGWNEMASFTNWA